MGATDFVSYGFGKDAKEAFSATVQDALYWSGHGGYTGTIAEKGSYVLFELPPRTQPRKFINWVETLAYEGDQVEYLREELKRLESTRAPRGQAAEWRQRKASMRKALKDGERKINSIPAAVRPVVERAAEVWHDKWGPAVAIEITGTEASRLKADNGLKGTRKRVFCFFGLASC